MYAVWPHSSLMRALTIIQALAAQRSAAHKENARARFTQAFPWPRYRAPMNDFSSVSASGAGFRAAPLQYRTCSAISNQRNWR